MALTRAVKLERAIEAKDGKALRKLLTVRELAFCEEYVIDFNGKAAAIRAGYAPKWADRQANLIKDRPGVRAYIDILTQSKAAKIMSVTPEYLIQRVTTIVNAEGARDGDKLRGIEMLMRHLGMFVDKTEITGRDGDAIRIESQRIEEESNSVVNLLKSMSDKNKDTPLVH